MRQYMLRVKGNTITSICEHIVRAQERPGIQRNFQHAMRSFFQHAFIPCMQKFCGDLRVFLTADMSQKTREALPGDHKCKDDSEEHPCCVVLWRPPPDDIELLQQQEELLPGALAEGGVKFEGLAALLGNRILLDHLLIPPGYRT